MRNTNHNNEYFQERIMRKATSLVNHIHSFHNKFDRPHGNITVDMLEDISKSIECQLDADPTTKTKQDDTQQLLSLIVANIERELPRIEFSSILTRSITTLQNESHLQPMNILEKLQSVTYFKKQSCTNGHELDTPHSVCWTCIKENEGKQRIKVAEEAKLKVIETIGTNTAFKLLVQQDGFSKIRRRCKQSLEITGRGTDALLERFEELPKEEKITFIIENLTL